MDLTNLTGLRIFADVIATGSFTAAAELHGVTQPAVSFHIRQLETQFGVQLIVREGRRAIATAAGAELLRNIAHIDVAVRNTMRAMDQFSDASGGALRIGTGSTACATLLPGILRQLRRSLPGTEISVITGNSPEIARKLTADEIDVGLVTLPVEGRTIESTPLFDDEIVMIASPSMDLPDVITPEVLFQHPAMMFESARVTRTLIDGWFANAGFTFHPAMTVGSLEAIRELVGMEMGYALLSRLALPADRVPDGLRVRSLSPQLFRTIGYAVRRDPMIPPATELFIAALSGYSGQVM